MKEFRMMLKPEHNPQSAGRSGADRRQSTKTRRHQDRRAVPIVQMTDKSGLNQPYSERSARIGGTAAARRAGTQLASMEEATKTMDTELVAIKSMDPMP